MGIRGAALKKSIGVLAIAWGLIWFCQPGGADDTVSEKPSEWKIVDQTVELTDAPASGTFRLLWNNVVDNRESGEDKPWVRTESNLISWQAPWLEDDEQPLVPPAATGYPVGVTTDIVFLDQRFALITSDWQDYGSGSNGEDSLYLLDYRKNRFVGGVHKGSPGHTGSSSSFWWPAEKTLLISGDEQHQAILVRLPATDKEAEVSTLAKIWQAGKKSAMPVPPADSFDYSDVITAASDGILLEYHYREFVDEGLQNDIEGHIKNLLTWQLLGVKGPPDSYFMRHPAYQHFKDRIPDLGVLNPEDPDWTATDEAGRHIDLPCGFLFGSGICAEGVWRLDNGIFGWASNEEADAKTMRKFKLPPVLFADEVASNALLLTTPYSIIALWPAQARANVIHRHEQVPDADENYPYFLMARRFAPDKYLVLEHVKAGEYGALSRMLRWTTAVDPFAAAK